MTDKNSSVRKAACACSAIMENMDKIDGSEYKEAIWYLINSRWTKGIKHALIISIRDNLDKFDDIEIQYNIK